MIVFIQDTFYQINMTCLRMSKMQISYDSPPRPAHVYPPRQYACMCLSDDKKRIYLSGGRANESVILNDLYELDLTNLFSSYSSLYLKTITAQSMIKQIP